MVPAVATTPNPQTKRNSTMAMNMTAATIGLVRRIIEPKKRLAAVSVSRRMASKMMSVNKPMTWVELGPCPWSWRRAWPEVARWAHGPVPSRRSAIVGSGKGGQN